MRIIAIATIGAFVFASCTTEDADAPAITLIGDQNMTIALNSTFTDPGATALDEKDGDLTSQITKTGTVNVNLAGTYTITYTVSDAAGNTGTKTRTVIVVNEKASWNGSYNVADVVGSGTPSNYTDNITASSTVNNRVWVTKFAFYTNGAVYFDFTSATAATIPVQLVNCGNPAADRTFSGNTTSVTANQLVFSYTESTNGTAVNGTETYVKQ